MICLKKQYKGKKPNLNNLPNQKKVKIKVYWKDSQCNTFAEFWIGGENKTDRPVCMVKQFLSFVLKYEWISVGEMFKHLTWWEYYKGKREDNGSNGV